MDGLAQQRQPSRAYRSGLIKRPTAFPIALSRPTPEAGAEIKDGKFYIPRKTGPVVGKNRVELRSFEKSGRMIQDPTAPPGTLTEEIANIFPPEYNSNSTLIREVQSGKNEIPFEISTK